MSTFNVARKGSTGYEVSRDLAATLSDPRWEDMVAGDHSIRVTVEMSAAVATAVNTLAVHDWIVKCQGTGRGKLGSGRDAVQAAVSAYKFGGGRTATVVVQRAVLDATAILTAGGLIDAAGKVTNAKMARIQIDAFVASGAEVRNIPAELAGQ